MDLALAIWQIDPAAEYRLNEDKSAILEWRGPGSEPTAEELNAAWMAYQEAHPASNPQQRAADNALVVQAFAAVVTDPAAQAALSRILDGLG
jgi:hypothetical protein